MEDFEQLKLDGQLCFPLYAAARIFMRRYTPVLAEIGLTYTQYITMLVLWEKGELTAKDLGRRLNLDSGTLTPLLKKMETKGLLSRKRSALDERNLVVSLTDEGRALKEKAYRIPDRMMKMSPLTPEETAVLSGILRKIIKADSEA